MSQHYENWLMKAVAAEKAGKFSSAVHCLEKARTHTGDDDERHYLDLWLKRMREKAPLA